MQACVPGEKSASSHTTVGMPVAEDPNLPRRAPSLYYHCVSSSELTHPYDAQNLRENLIVTPTMPLPHAWLLDAIDNGVTLRYTGPRTLSFPLICCQQSFTQRSLIKSYKKSAHQVAYWDHTQANLSPTFTVQVWELFPRRMASGV